VLPVLAAFWQIPSSLVFALAESFDFWMPCLQLETAALIWSGVSAAAGVEVLVLVVELPLLPQPAISAPPASATTSHVDGFELIYSVLQTASACCLYAAGTWET